MADSEDSDHNINASSKVPSHLPLSALARHLDPTGMVSPFCKASAKLSRRLFSPPIVGPCSDP